MRSIALAILFAASLSAALAEDASAGAAPGGLPRRIYHATRLSSPPPQIDGRLDDACWSGPGSWDRDYIQREPHEGRPASEPTHIKLLYDDRNIYVAFRAFDSQLDSIQHMRGKRDEFTGEMVGVAFDSYFDKRTAFEFDVTSGGSKLDLVLRNDGWDTSWNAVWDARVGRETGAWTAEFRIPLSQLRYANKPAQVWGMHSWRWIRRFQEESNWQLLPMDNSGFVFSFGELHGIADLPRARNIELMPYAVARHATSEAEPGNPFRTGSESAFEGGLDAKIALTSNFTVDLTLNPDFGQVEADPSEINLTTYETFFSEKRPFFLEGKNIFDWSAQDDRLFYSRRIGHAPSFHPPTSGYSDVPTATRILGAAKLTGKTPHGLALGMLYGLTDRETARIREGETARIQTVEPLTHHFAARAQQDIAGGRTIVGGILTATRRDIDDPALEFLPEAAYTGGLDAQHFWSDRAYKVDLKLMGSRIEGSGTAIRELMLDPVHNFQRPDADHLDVDVDARALDGHGGLVRVGKDSGGKWRYAALVDWRSPGLELNDLGYLYVADTIRQATTLNYVETEPRAFYRNFNVHLHQNSTFDFDRTHLRDDAHLDGNLTFRNNWSIHGRFAAVDEALDTRVLRGGPALLVPGGWETSFEINSASTKDYRYYVGLEREEARDADSAATEIETGFATRLFEVLNLDTDVSYEINHEDFQFARRTTTSAPDAAARYMMGRLDQRTLTTTARVELNFSPQLSLAWYGEIFLTSGRYSDFKLVTAPRASRYRERFRTLDGSMLTYDLARGTYAVSDADGDFAFNNPDFDYRALRSNLVLRWEYRPGSSVYAVWTQNRDSSERGSGFSAGDEYRRLFSAHPDNTFLIKASYWFSL